MQEVIIDNKQGLVVWNGQQIPRLLLRMIQGAVGKSFVVKHYRDKRGRKKIVVTRYPEMQGVVASNQQRVRRDLFREAVVYARWIISDEERKQAYRKALPRKKRRNVYQAALQLYMRMQGDGQWLRKQLAVRSMMQSGRIEIVEEKGIYVGRPAALVSVFAREQKQTLQRGFAGGAEGVCSGSGFEPPGSWVVVWSEKEEVVVVNAEYRSSFSLLPD